MLFRLYQFAREDKNNVKLLEDCNKVFVNPKADKVEKSVAKSEKKVKGPDFVDAFLAILERLKISIVVALDQVDSLSSNAQQELASKLKAVLTSSTRTGAGDLAIKILVGCRSGTRFFDEMDSTGYLLDVEAFSDDDISKKLLDSLKKIPALSSQEQEEAKDAILRKAGSRFDYVNDIAIPFMREPFRRPLSERLLALPEGMNNIYIEALRKMRPNYIDLLRSALKWSLWAPVPVPVEVIMDAYQGTYKSHDPLVEEEAIASNNETFRAPSDLEIKQLRDAGRAFLRVVKSPDTYDHLVELIDPPRIREFCAHAEQAGSVEGHSEGVVCARCKSSLAETKALSLVERDVHLELALVCLRHLNHPIFQKFATAGYPDEQPQLIQSEVSNAPPTPGGGDGLDSESEKVSSADAAQTEKDESKNDERQENDSEKGAENLVAKTELPSNNPDEEGLGSERSSDVVGYDSDDSMEAEDYVKRSIDAQEEEESYFEEDNDVETGGRKIRYEASYWTYHFREADNSWTAEERQLNSTWAELMSEVNLFVVQNTSFFCHWQKILDIPSAPLKPLHVASYYGLTSWAEEILKAGGDPNEWSGSPERNALQAAARGVSDYPELRGSDNLPIMRILLEHGGDPNAESTEVIPAFHSWLSNDFTIEAVKLMLDHGADPAYQSQQDQFSIIHECAWGAQDAKVLPLLLDHTVNGLKADINALTSYGSNPLHLLLTRRDVPIPLLEAFIERGADVNKDDSSSARPLQLACIWGEFEALKVLCRDKQVLMMDDDDDMGNTAIHQAACGSHTDCIEFLVENGASIDAQNKAGRTALHLCAWYGAKECVRILLSHGANANITDKHGRTPLFFACHGNSPEIASILLDTLVEKKVPVAAVNTLTKRRRCVLRHAADRGFDQIVERIISMAQEQDDLDSLSINEADTQKGMTALHRAALSGHTRCVELLLAENLKADATATDKDGKTPLVRAYEQWTLANDQEEYEKIISMLISKAPQVAISDAELIAHCAANGSEFLLRQLADLGADLKRQDRYGWTPLELARRFRRTVVEQYLTQQAAWADLLPSQWARDERLKISEDGKRLEHLSGKRFCISTDKPLPAGLDTFYFEVSTKRIGEETNGGKSQPQYPEIAVGFCTIGGAAIQFPGWMPREDVPSARSWGYHGDDGGLYNSSQSSYEEMRANQFFGPQYQPGDTVGCGVNLTKGEIWFTRNGEKMEKGFDNVQGRLFPLLGLRHKIVVETNFEGPFLWQSNP